MDATEMEDTLPKSIGRIDLEAKAKELGITHFVACFSSLATRYTNCHLVHISSARHFQQWGADALCPFLFDLEIEARKLQMVPVPETLIQLPWQPELAWIACELYLEGKPFNQCPRRCLRKVLQHYDAKGYVVKGACEFEFVLYKKDSLEAVGGQESEFQCYLDPKTLLSQSTILTEAADCLHAQGWEVIKTEKECMSGQYELTMKYTDALSMADRHMFFKFMIKSIAEKEGCRAIFMPFPTPARLGNGMHYNVSLWDKDTDTNLMPGDNAKLKLSQLGQQMLAGIMDNIEAMCAFACPTVNSYKRLTAFPNFLNSVSYGVECRWAPIRIPLEGDRLEYRLPDGAVSPYLLPAHVLAAGLSGIDNNQALDPKQLFDKKLEMGTPQLPDFKVLPTTLLESLSCLKENEQLPYYLGKEVVDGLCKVKHEEIKSFNKAISQWELDQVDDY